ncbi:MAG TPA: S41 family peptidase [Vicinamibacterales bacterium]|nr:S41 family peptidase [Vicinamibacterales bacterium]
MTRRLALAIGLVITFVWAAGPRTFQAQSAAPQAPKAPGPIKLARYPDYHAGKIAFSYLGDIWTASEDGSNATRLTINTALEAYPRFSPDGRWIAFSSNRFGNNDVFIVPATGGAPRQLTFFSGGDDVVGWTRDGQHVLFRSSHNDGAFPGVATLYTVPIAGGPERPLPVDWGYYGDFSPDGKELVFNRHPSVWTRKHYRGAYAADLWVASLDQKNFRQLLGGELYNRYWPMWSADGNIYYVADPLPNDKNVKPGAADVYKSANNIYRIAANGSGQPTQVTHHTSGSLFWPSMSSDGKVIVYEESFGVWKLDVGTGKSTEIKIEIATDDKENEFETRTLQNDVDSFDLSPSGQRAIISASGQLLTIATSRGDITRIAPDNMASRNQTPRWSPDGKFVAYISDKSGRDEVWVGDADGRNLKAVTNLDNEKGALAFSPDSRLLLYTAADKKLYSYSMADARTTVITSDTVARIGSFSISPDSKWVAFSKQDRTLRSHVYIAPIGGGEEKHVSDDSVLFSEANPVWTGDGRYLVFTSSEGFSNGIATQGGITTTTELWVAPLRDQERDPLNRDIDSEAAALAAQAAGGGRAGGAGAAGPVTVQIDWNNLAHRARQVTVPGDAITGLVASPTGNAVAFNLSTAGGAGGRGAAAPAANTAGIYVLTVDANSLTRMPAATPADAGAGGGRGRGAATAGAGAPGQGMSFTRDGRTLYFRAGTGLFSAAVGGGGAATSAPAAGGGGGGRGGGRGGGGGAAAAAAPEASGSARQITYTATIQVDKKALRAQVFNEGWRIMKNRFYDAEMHGTDWSAQRTKYAALLDNLVDEEELHNVMMMMIGELNASHTGVSGGPSNAGPSTGTTRNPGFEVVFDSSGYYRVGHIYKTGPADHDYLKVRTGDYILALDDRDLKTTDNYWQRLTFPATNKLRFLLNDKPSKDGAWEVAITPGGNNNDLQYRKWVSDRRAMVDKLSNGEFGYLHIRAMDAPSLRQFQLDLAANRTKKALVIDQRFNGGGGIDQELLQILAGREYQYTVGRDAGVRQPRPQNFYGPMVVMQNERSASDAEMFPAGFRALGLGKVIGVPTMGAVIGTGSYTLLDGSAIRTPGSGVWLTKDGQNMENFGVPPDVYVDNTPASHAQGRDLQIEKAVEVLKADVAARARK